jgi:predicted transcriptional regulator
VEGTLMVKRLPSLGELESLVLRLVCQEQPCTERQISERIQKDRSVGRTTVLKTMQRLEAKRLLVRVAGPGPVRFRAAVDERRLLPSLIGRFVDRVLGGSPEALAAYLAGSEKLSAKDVEALRAIAKKLEQEGR